MEFTFLGTGAAEQYPGLWCTCEYCTKARKMGGRNIRHTSSGHFAGDCLIDFPPETFTQGERYGVDLLASRLLLVTHSHEDHFYPQLLYWRYRPKEAADMSEEEKFKRGYSRQQELPTLYIYGNQCTYHTLADHFNGQDLEDFAIKFIVPELYQEYECNGVRFVPMEASHIDRGSSKGLIYSLKPRERRFCTPVIQGRIRRGPGNALPPINLTQSLWNRPLAMRIREIIIWIGTTPWRPWSFLRTQGYGRIKSGFTGRI